ncbi:MULTISPECIES: DUF3147 family protein [Methylocaldum]|jgi:hypothetical protein|uniref:DUF3147 family protein n=1 Tax=unclassified Methylocaldum TaxID=2622260 RepID=UPI001F0A180B|nr:DUF3147 family protein [Methylocaldum sp. 14B]
MGTILAYQPPLQAGKQITQTAMYLKVLISALLIAVISETAKRSSLVAALIASLPITSILAFIWLYVDTGDTELITELSRQIVWLVIPSLAFFWILPLLLERSLNFWLALGLAAIATSVCYGLVLLLRNLF